MPTQLDNTIQRLITAKSDIATAIVNKGGTVSLGDGYEDFASDIAAIPYIPPTYAFIMVTVPANTTVVLSKGQTTIDTQTSTSGEELIFKVPESGTYTATATQGQSVSTQTVQVSERTAYYITINFSVTVGVSWSLQYDSSNRSYSYAFTRTDDAALLSDPVPAVSGGNGSSPFDSIYPWSDITTVTKSRNSFIKIPKFYIKLTSSSIQISNTAKDGFVESPGHMGYDYLYVGRYRCTSSTTSSKSGETIGSFYPYQASNYYQLEKYMTLFCLFVVEMASFDVTKIGTSPNNITTTGGADSMSYHTGTMANSRSTAGITRYRYVESLFGGPGETLGYNFMWNGVSSSYRYPRYITRQTSSDSRDTEAIYYADWPSDTSLFTGLTPLTNHGYYDDWLFVPTNLVGTNLGYQYPQHLGYWYNSQLSYGVEGTFGGNNTSFISFNGSSTVQRYFITSNS